MADTPKISQAEWEVMKALWERAPQTANEVVAALSGKVSWNDKTIKTLLGRLVQKGALGFRKEGRQYSYYPLVDQVESVRQEARSFLRLAKGVGLKPVLATFLEEEKLSSDEIAELRQLIEQIEGRDP